MKPKAFLIGGAGYIGSHVADYLLECGHDVFVFDDLSAGHKQAVPSGAQFAAGDVTDFQTLCSALAEIKPHLIYHFAAKAAVGESFTVPENYFHVNVGGTACLLRAVQHVGLKDPIVIFSSSCTVYGEPDTVPIPSDAPFKPPTNPYGETKQICERMLNWCASCGRLRYAALRYFNAAGAWGALGEDHNPETHLIPIALQAVVEKRKFKLFGTDYPTPDGTCVRDYVHVRDLAIAHKKVGDYLMENRDINSLKLNLGSGVGSSILDVVKTVQSVTGRKLVFEKAEPRPGDIPELVADITATKQIVQWEPKHSSLDEIIRSAWKWMQANPSGYKMG